jgi:hypothetical protein
MRRFVLVLIPVLIVYLVGGSYNIAYANLGSECRSGRDAAKAKIAAISDPAKKQQAQQLEKAAYTDLISGEYQNCLDKLKQIDALAK